MRFFIIFLFSFLFACNTSNYNTAYQDYYKNQQLYIKALLNNDKIKQINTLKKLIKCGKYLNFNVRDYEKKLKKLQFSITNKKIIKKRVNKHLISKQNIKNNYITILSYSPLKIKNITTYSIFNMKTKTSYKKIIDLKYTIISKPYIYKKLSNILTLKIAQYKKNIVRIVYSSTKPIKIHLKKIKNILIINPIIKYKNVLKTPTKTYPNIFQHKKIIVIDPGHGGKDSGGIGIGRRFEKTAVLEIAKKVKKYLIQKGYIVFLTRRGDYFIPLKKRTHFANEKHADLFISIHCNIAPRHIRSPHGIETYFLSPTRSERAIRVAKLENKEIQGLNYLDQRVILNFLNKDRIISSNKLAIDIQTNILREIRTKYSVKDGGVRPAPFWVLVGTQMPAILIETGYLTNPIESKRLFNPDYQNRLAKGIAKGVEEYFRKNP